MSPCRGLFSCRRRALFIERPSSVPGAHFNGVSADLLQTSEHSPQWSLTMILIYNKFLKLTVALPKLKTITIIAVIT